MTIVRPAYSDVNSVLSRVLENGSTKMVFVMNIKPDATKVTVTVDRGGNELKEITEIVDGGNVSSSIKDGKIVIKEEMPGYGAKVYRCEF